MIELEHVSGGDAIGRNFEKLMALVVDAGGQSVSIRFGSSSVVFTASSTSAQRTVAHGLPTTPVAVFTTCANPVTGRVTVQESAAADATNVYLTGFQTQGTSVSITQGFYWLTIG